MNLLPHYKYEVHKYLDAIWGVGSNKSKARSAMYKWLSVQMSLDMADTHVSNFNLKQCKQALKILKPRYRQLFEKKNINKCKHKDVIKYKGVNKNESNKTL